MSNLSFMFVISWLNVVHLFYTTFMVLCMACRVLCEQEIVLFVVCRVGLSVNPP